VAHDEAFNQRLTVRYHLGPLDSQETLAYVRHHVRVAGFTASPLFTDDAITHTFEYTKGLPRRIRVSSPSGSVHAARACCFVW